MRNIATFPSSARTRSYRRAYLPDVTPSLGCSACAYLEKCGGLRDLSRRMTCMDDCCGGDPACDIVCPRHPDFAQRYVEVDGFAFPSLARLPLLRETPLPAVIPVIYHPNRRSGALDVPAAAVPLFKLLERADGAPRYATPESLRAAFRISHDASIYLTGVDRDRPLERLWEVGRTRRREITRRLLDLNILGLSSPNYSTFRDVPRTDALHALSRIAIVFEEMRRAGANAAFHINGIAERDYERSAAWINTSDLVTHVAADFSTGTKRRGRGRLHATLLAALGRSCNGRLHLVLRGGAAWLPLLVPAFAGITLLDTSSFCRTMWRRQAVPLGNAALEWLPHATATGEPLDNLLARNIDAHGSFLRDAIAAARPAA